MKLSNFIEFRDWLYKVTANMKDEHILGEQEVLYMVKDKFSSLGLNDNKIDMEPIDEDKLDELATKEAKKWYDDVKTESNYDFWRECFECYKAGYRNAFNNL